MVGREGARAGGGSGERSGSPNGDSKHGHKVMEEDSIIAIFSSPLRSETLFVHPGVHGETQKIDKK